MKVYIAKHAGFCSGVERSAKLADSNCYKKPIYTWGPLIHNKQFVNYLKSKKINPTEDISKIKNGTVIIRSHGITKDEFRKLNKTGADIIDGTCPNVTRVQKLAHQLEKSSHEVIIFGDKSHPEVIGIVSHLIKPIIVENITDAKRIHNLNKPVLISQTTQSKEVFNKIKNILKLKFKNILIKDTICQATQLRQDSAKKLSDKVDIMIVIGGKHSSNTKKLFDTCKLNTKSYHIETYTELNSKWFKSAQKIGITAGASTPNWVINRVIKAIKKF